MPAVTSHSDSALCAESPFTWVKADFHLHTAEDPFDEVDYTALELLDIAHDKGFGALAVTLHRRVFQDERVFERARELGILLIQAVELRIDMADVVVLNVGPGEAANIRSFDDLRSLRERRGDSVFIFAPHPYYVFGGSIGKRAEEHIECFDAIEFCHFHVPLFNPNRRAARLAAAHGKPLLATSDAHRRRFFGSDYSLLGVEGRDGTPTVDQVFSAMRAHRIRLVNPPRGLLRFFAALFFVLIVTPIMRRRPGSRRAQSKRRRALLSAQRDDLAMAAGTPIDPSVNL